jgi:hypothetical protein
MSYNRNEQFANLEREERRNSRRNSLPPPVVQQPQSVLFSFERIKALSPFLQKLLRELSSKYGKIKCSITNTDQKLYTLEQYRLMNSLPKHMHFQQKFVNNLEDMEAKTNMINHLLKVEMTKLTTIKTDMEAKYNDMYADLESYFAEGTSYRKQLEEVKPFLSLMIEDQYHLLQLKMSKDRIRKEEKERKFLEKKERDEEPIEVTHKDISKLLNQIEKLKIEQRKISKNVNGKVGRDPKKNSTLPKNAKSKAEKKPGDKKKKDSKGNGKRKNTSIKRRY